MKYPTPKEIESWPFAPSPACYLPQTPLSRYEQLKGPQRDHTIIGINRSFSLAAMDQFEDICKKFSINQFKEEL